MKKFLTIVVSLLLFVVSALFFAQNDSQVVVNYFSGQLDWQLNWVMVASLLVGFGLGVSSVVGSLMKAKFQLRQAKSKLEKHQKEINSLRSLPVKDEY